MNQVIACVDGIANTTAVVDWSIWAAQRLETPLCFLHVIQRHPERSAVGDYSGAIGLGAQQSLLQSLSELDEQQARLAQQSARQILAAAQQRAEAADLTRVAVRLRHGDLVDTVGDMEADARLFVLGEHYRAPAGTARLHLDHHVERVIRSVSRPVLVATGSGFAPPRHCVIAYDGSTTASKAVDMVARSPLLAGLPLLLAMAGADVPPARAQLEQACHRLREAGFAVTAELVPGDPETALPAVVKAHGASLLVIGAYGHSRIRHLIVGSTTTTLLRTAEVPVLVLR